MAQLSLEHISKTYDGNVKAVDDFCLDVSDQEFINLVGPSGCGKSTTLRMIAGLEEISSGTLTIDGKVMNDTEPKDRDIAMVFQNYALYPHMTVYDNMAFSLKVRHLPKDEIDRKVRQAAEILNLTPLLNRRPKALSGGQKQSVAMGRAIVRNPKVFLMDEPLSNLDAKLRVQMRLELARLHRNLKATIIYVTHDQTEAMTLGSRIVVMDKGRIQQVASPQELYKHPANLFVAGFIGSPQMNFLSAEIRTDRTAVCLDAPVPFPDEFAKKLPEDAADREWILGIRPEDLTLLPEDADGTWKAEVQFYELLGAEAHVLCTADSQQISVKVSSDKVPEIGSICTIAINEEALHFFDKETEDAIF